MRTTTIATLFAIAVGGLSFAPSVAAAKSARDFVTLCDTPTPSDDCVVDYQLTSVAVNWERPQHCAPIPRADNMFPEYYKQIRAVIVWLKAHPSALQKSDVDGVLDALKALYPCKP